MLKKGDLVEFTREHHFSYPPKDVKRIIFGVAIKDEELKDNYWSAEVELADGTIETATFIHAYGWAGWCPEDLEAVYEKHNRGKWGNDIDEWLKKEISFLSDVITAKIQRRNEHEEELNRLEIELLEKQS